MCSPARCSRCGKTTWSGCGRHVDTVMGEVPEVHRCTCVAPIRRSLAQRLLGR
jgi:hypothetical protein